MPAACVLALYRTSFFYGVCRWLAWITWAHVFHSYQFDITWGGPGWVPAVSASMPRTVGPLPIVAACPCGACCGG